MATSLPDAQSAPSGPEAATLAAMEHEAERDRQESNSAWAFLWILLAFKLATVVMIFWNEISSEAGVFVGVTTWYWSIIPILATAGPIVYRVRRRRVRRRLEQLKRAEWLLEH